MVAERWASIHYDPMLAKVIAWAPTGSQAAAVLANALAAARIHGLTTNRDLLVRGLRHPAFLAGRTDTAFFDTHGLDTLTAPLADGAAAELSAVAAALAALRRGKRDAPVLGGLPLGWRNVRVGQPGQAVPGTPGTASGPVHPRRAGATRTTRGPAGGGSPDRVVLAVGGAETAFEVAAMRTRCTSTPPLAGDGCSPRAALADPGPRSRRARCLRPMPGSVIRVGAAVGRQGHGRPAADVAGGHEDGAHDRRAQPPVCSPN